ncbi:alpha/beta hydrolase [Angustibacter sp. McL0619]|uniref:alpha/beta hydrolase n=1 Tax=Angustibacter sp. McL0619 TaxID=3415676 RepID=UPI003CF2706D
MASAIVAAALALSLVSACTSGDDAPAAGSPNAPSVTTAPVPDRLATFYDQKLSWKDCRDGFECTELTVPVDYDKPDGPTIGLSVIRLPAGKPKQRIGSLLINPGGPGASGVSYARSATSVISNATRRSYDVVGFDPRGVAASDPLDCLSDKQTDTMLGADPTPDTAAEVATTVQLAKLLGNGCEQADPALVGHVDTVSAARDMDVLRAALGDKRLSYLGKSYGTFLGASYADLFPQNIGRMVLDGAIDPSLTSEQIDLGQAKGFEQATRSFVADCVSSSGCPLGSTVDGGMRRLQGLLASLDEHPLPSGEADRPLTEGWGSLGIALAMYDPGFWPTLRQALDKAFGGDGSGLMRLADVYADRSARGTYDTNQNSVIYAVNCLDRPDDGGVAEVKSELSTFENAAPTWGRFLAWSALPCSFWPVKGSGKPHKITAAGSPPIVVVGTTRDPATPYPWAQGLAAQLADGHLITHKGDGHTAYMRGSRCVDKAVDGYLLRGTVPKDGLTC